MLFAEYTTVDYAQQQKPPQQRQKSPSWSVYIAIMQYNFYFISIQHNSVHTQLLNFSLRLVTFTCTYE